MRRATQKEESGRLRSFAHAQDDELRLKMTSNAQDDEGTQIEWEKLRNPSHSETKSKNLNLRTNKKSPGGRRPPRNKAIDRFA